MPSDLSQHAGLRALLAHQCSASHDPCWKSFISTWTRAANFDPRPAFSAHYESSLCKAHCKCKVLNPKVAPPYPRVNLSSPCAQLDANGDEYGTLDPVSVTLDNATTSAYSLVNIVAADRKGLFYDLMRTLKDIHLRVAYAKVPQTLIS